MSHLQIAVLRGGPSEEYAVSMKTGAAVIDALSNIGYYTKDIVISRGGQWLDKGIVKEPEAALMAVDVVFIALHGAYGEDGEVQKVLQRLGIPFTGSRAFPSAIAFNKKITKQSLLSYGILMPKYREVTRDTELDIETLVDEVINEFGPEYIIKPTSSGSSFGTQFISEGQSLDMAIMDSLKMYPSIIIEEFIRGREATCAVLEDFRNENIYSFPAIEIITPRDVQYFNTDSKYSGQTLEVCPSNFSYSDKSTIADVSTLVHKVLDLSQYSRSDFIVNNKGVYFLEVNTLPGLTNESLYPKAAASVGLSLNQLIEHLVDKATC